METVAQDTPLIDMRGVSYVYRQSESDDVVALRDIDLAVEHGEFVAVVGANGSGKSTLAKLMNALLVPSEGSVRIDGMLTSDKKNLWDVRRTVGMVFQNPDNQLVSTTVEQEVAFGLENLGVPHEKMHQVVDDVLGEVGVAQMRKDEPHNLSGGQKQRVAIASVLAMEPTCLVLDEATSMLDPQSRSELMEAVKSLSTDRGLTVVCITHFMQEAAQADRIIAMSEGEVVADGQPHEIFGGEVDLEAIGLDTPPVTMLADNLRDKGIPMPEGIVAIEEFVGALCRYHLRK